MLAMHNVVLANLSRYNDIFGFQFTQVNQHRI